MRAMSLGKSITNTSQQMSKTATDSDLVLAAKKEVRAFEKLYNTCFYMFWRHVYVVIVGLNVNSNSMPTQCANSMS